MDGETSSSFSTEESSFPSTNHEIIGIGFPIAEHFSETDDPGCKLWEINVCISSGSDAANKKEKIYVRI